jgi:hypothetical protein
MEGDIGADDELDDCGDDEVNDPRFVYVIENLLL